MKTTVCFLIFLLSIYPLSGYGRLRTNEDQDYQTAKDNIGRELTPMEALDLVKSIYASNFNKLEATEEEYYYKLDIAAYYLVCEGLDETEQQYLLHLYEFVEDEPEEGIGHTVTYGWYHVDKMTGAILEVQR